MFPTYIFTSLLMLTSVLAATLNVNRTEGRVLNVTSCPEPPKIPIRAIGCWQHRFNEEDLREASRKLKEWGVNRLIKAGSWHGAQNRMTGVWICNCKHFYPDHVVPWELDEAQLQLRENCGQHQSGWVWSQKWKKMYNFGNATLMNRKGIFSGKCPPFCLWSLE